MLGVLLVVFPVFLLIAAGYGAVRVSILPDETTDALTEFATRIAVPSLLFSKLAEVELSAVFMPGMLISFYAGVAGAFLAAALLAVTMGVSAPRAVTIGFAAMYSNSVLIGLPVMARAYGEEAAEPMYGIIAFHAPVIMSVGMIVMAAAHQRSAPPGGGGWRAVGQAMSKMLGNAIMIGVVLGLAVNITGLSLPGPLWDAIKLVAGAALPVALFALGASLTRYPVKQELGWAGVVAVCSLILHPGIAYVLGAWVFELEPHFLRAAVITAAMPAGLNAYIFAALWREGEGVAASSVVLGTALAVLSVSAWLAILGGAA